MRISAHAVFDELWKGGKMTRQGAYIWMQKALGISAKEAHIGRFDKATCTKLIRAVWARDEEHE
jgi:hypothetical protein